MNAEIIPDNGSRVLRALKAHPAIGSIIGSEINLSDLTGQSLSLTLQYAIKGKQTQVTLGIDGTENEIIFQCQERFQSGATMNSNEVFCFKLMPTPNGWNGFSEDDIPLDDIQLDQYLYSLDTFGS